METAAAVPARSTDWSRIRETVLVIGLFWVPLTYRSAYYFFHPIGPEGVPAGRFDVSSLVVGLLILGLIAHLSALRSSETESIVGSFHGTDLILAILLAVGAQIAGRLCSSVSFLLFGPLALTGGRTANLAALRSFPKGVLLLWAVYSPVVEEVVMRGYLQTRLRQLGVSAWVAVLASATLQASYHLYQGVPAVVHQFGVFLAFAIAFHFSRRLSLTLGAHFATDLYLTLAY